MTTYNLPEGMTAEKLRELADFMKLHGLFVNGGMVHAWAAAIDPPKPPPVVTDEMVRTYAVERWGGRMDMDPNDSDRKDLEAVERLGWLRDPDEDAPDSEGNHVDCPTCGMSWIQCCEHRSKGLDNCCMACDEVGQRRNHTPQEGDGDDAELDALCTDIALEVVKRERDRWQKDCLVAEASEKRLADRLAMAEGLLRKATAEGLLRKGLPTAEDVLGILSDDWVPRGFDLTPAEAEYLRSLDGEDDGDE